MSVKMIATNKTARRDYEISETYEAGIMLRGSEVKSLRESNVRIADTYARFEDGQLFVVGLHIALYTRAGTHVKMEAERKRKLLMHRYELDRLSSKIRS